MSSSCSDTSLKSSSPLNNCLFNDVLLQLITFIRNAMAQLINILDLCSVDLFLQWVPNFIIDRIYVRAIWGPQRWQNKVSVAVFDCILSTMRWSSILLKNEIIWVLPDVRQKISRQKHISVIFAIYFDTRSTKWRSVRPNAEIPTDTMTVFEKVGRRYCIIIFKEYLRNISSLVKL